jgi:hypothetical protein
MVVLLQQLKFLGRQQVSIFFALYIMPGVSAHFITPAVSGYQWLVMAAQHDLWC